MNYLFNLQTIFLYEKGGEGGGGGGNPPIPPAVKTFNQDELNGIVGSRIAEERKRIYALAGVENEADLQKRLESVTTLEKENATLKTQVQDFEAKVLVEEQTKKLIEAGIEPTLVDVALIKWDGEQDLETFISENEKLTKAFFESANFQGTGGSLGGKGGTKVDTSKMTDAEYIAYRREQDKKQ